MSTYVLVHGAWSGAHTFRRVRPPLQAAGHAVFTPSLTGIGERVHLAHAGIDLTTHVRDVVHHILYEDLDSIVLLGFSYGGCVVTGALAHIATRVRHLVYLDAFVPEDGQSLSMLTGGPSVDELSIGQAWLVPPTPRQFDDPEEAAFAAPRRVPHPIGCFREPVYLPRPLEDYPFERTYIRATAGSTDAPGTAALEAAASRARASAAWHYREMDTTHMIPNNRPAELADLLLAMG